MKLPIGNRVSKLEHEVEVLNKKLDILMSNFEKHLAAQIDAVVAEYEATILEEQEANLKLARLLERELREE